MDENLKSWSFHADYLTLPRKVVESLFRKEINLTELQIFAVVQCFSKTAQGCFITNEAFAKICGVVEHTISIAVSHLREIGLLEQVGFDGRKRYLRATGWELKNTEKSRQTSTEISSQTLRLASRQDLSPASRLYIYNNNNLIGITKNIPADEPQGGERKPSIYQKMALKFQKAIPIKKTSPSNPKSEGIFLKSFCHREGIELPRAKKVLKWYCSQFDAKKNPYSRKYLPLYVPQAISMRTFCQKFIDIECAMLRMTGAPIESEKKQETIQLPPEQEKALQAMTKNIQYPQTALLSTLPKIIPGLFAALTKYRQRTKDLVKTESTRNLYLESLFTKEIFFHEYALWIELELYHWESWSGDFNVFRFGASPFQKYLNSVILRAGFDKEGILGDVLAE
jgi:hypothetical protein